ncbi:hypothetical protein QE152_g22625 [Popillia japonica]|uniref:Uncharacterized protein n=1 Tax=Popillia japonica TaxID=7064 RepID=A0AAW1KJC5_POPJA
MCFHNVYLAGLYYCNIVTDSSTYSLQTFVAVKVMTYQFRLEWSKYVVATLRLDTAGLQSGYFIVFMQVCIAVRYHGAEWCFE